MVGVFFLGLVWVFPLGVAGFTSGFGWIFPLGFGWGFPSGFGWVFEEPLHIPPENWMAKPCLLVKKSVLNCRMTELKVLWMSPGSPEPLISFSRIPFSTGPSQIRSTSWNSSVWKTMKWSLWGKKRLEFRPGVWFVPHSGSQAHVECVVSSGIQTWNVLCAVFRQPIPMVDCSTFRILMYFRKVWMLQN